jgi:molybdopterin/thiamine biosynthesis adenylyltransferase
MPAKKFHHEEIYRGKAAMEQLTKVKITICGAGALGSNLVENLSRQGFTQMKLIDMDRVEEHNLGTQIFGQTDIGALKVDAVKNRVFRTVGAEVETVNKELTPKNARQLLKGANLVIDVFDNAESRQAVQDACREASLSLLHAGLFEDYAEVIWDAHYKVPQDAQGDVCDYPLARNLIILAATVTSEEVLRFSLGEKTGNWTITLRDYAVKKFED